MELDDILGDLPATKPVLIAGPTASGKSGLALAIAKAAGGVVVNADALQVFENWRILTARPSRSEEEVAPHRLYGHVPGDQAYSVGHWLRDLAPLLAGPERPIIVGGTGLYFTALTEGLAEIPETPDTVRAEADGLRLSGRIDRMIAELDPDTAARIDRQNPMRVQRAWEVQQSTGRGLAAWQDDTPPPLLPLETTLPLVLDAERDWLRDRIARRFDAMLAEGALHEAERNREGWSPDLPSAKAIGAQELIDHLEGRLSLDAARDAAIIASQQYAKRQRTWFRARMKGWTRLPRPHPEMA